MRNKKVLTAAMAAAGIACLIIGLFVVTDPALKLLSGMLTGFGAAVGVTGLGNLVLLIAVPQAVREDQQRKKDIEVNDERNIRIREKAGAASGRIVFYALCAAVLALGMLGDIRAVLVLTGVIALQFVMTVAFTGHYSKRI